MPTDPTAATPDSRRQASDAVLRAIAYVKAEAPEGTPQLPEAYRHLADQLPVTQPLGNGLVVSYLYDEGQVFSYVQQHHLSSLNTRVEALHELALINLGRLANGKLRIFHHGTIHGVMLDQQFEASVLLLDEFWEGPARQYTPHGAVAAVPSRGVLLFCDREAPDGIAELRGHLAKGVAAGGIELSAELFARNARGDWAVLPEVSSP
ncbi:hypothetical protein [Aquabacterium sp. OR-4]|uniref:hypothetical protein n=1 Tax=Aquabacterium sp. OR-4 TaxID=2978127 RepID=UPI0021B2ED54|nr:hypothetical protein [Aquabacterium sp. OR-4]MDT7838370.1 hypothetical protein [Aquabacterium sp. OR-4]